MCQRHGSVRDFWFTEMDKKKKLQVNRLQWPPVVSNISRKATVAYPTVKRLLFHMFYATRPQKLLKSHEMV